MESRRRAKKRGPFSPPSYGRFAAVIYLVYFGLSGRPTEPPMEEGEKGKRKEEEADVEERDDNHF